MKRRWLVLLSVVAAGATAAGLAVASGGTVRARFTNYGFTLRHPAAWTRVNWCWSGVHVIPIALLTTAQPTPTCTQPVVGVGVSWPPAVPLGADGVTVALALQAVFPGIKPTWNARIGGQPAFVARPAYGRKEDTAVTCPAGIRREYRSVRIRRPGHAVLMIGAAICGPHLHGGEAAFHRLLRSIRFTR